MKTCYPMLIGLLVIGATNVVFTDVAWSLTDQQLRQFDKDGDKNVDPGMEAIFFRHLANATLAKYDLNLNGQFDPEEVAEMNSDVQKVDLEPESADIRLRVREGVPVPVNTAFEKVEVISGTDIRYQPFLRNKRANIGISGNALKALDGASFTYSQDFENNRNAVSVEAAAGVLFRNSRVDYPENYSPGDLALTAYALGPFVEANGAINSANTRLTAGVIGQAEFLGGLLLDSQLLSASPYYQTDFEGSASIYGGAITWQPFDSELALGTFRRLPGGADFTWLLAGEADYKYADDPGNTGLAADSGTYWLGVNASAKLLPFAEQLDGRLFLSGGIAYYYEVLGGIDATLSTAKVGYSLDPDKNTSIEFIYSNGRDHNTLRQQEIFKAALSVKY